MSDQPIADQFKAALGNESERGQYRQFPLRLRRMRALSLYAKGEMPLNLANAYLKAFGVETDEEFLDRPLRPEEFEENAKFQIDVVLDCCVEPRIGRNPGDDCDVVITDLPDDLIEFIYLYAMRLANFADGEKSEVTAETLKPFLHNGKGQTERPSAGQRSKTLRLPAKRDAATGDGRAVA